MMRLTLFSHHRVITPISEHGLQNRMHIVLVYMYVCVI